MVNDPFDFSQQESLLRISLSAAVPLWIQELKHRDWSYLTERAKICAQEVAEHGDNLLFRSEKRGESARAFNRFAEGLAILSMVPGGVNIFGLHFECREKRGGTEADIEHLQELRRVFIEERRKRKHGLSEEQRREWLAKYSIQRHTK